MLRLVVLTAFLGCLSASPAANQFFDSVLNTAFQNVIRDHNLNPFRIDDFTTEFEDKLAFVDVKVVVNYTDGNLTGLSGVRRYYECMGPYYSFEKVKVNCTLSLYDLKTSYAGKIKYGKLPVVSIKARANVTESLWFVELTAEPPSYIPAITNDNLSHLGEIQTTFTGLGALNKQLKSLEDDYRAHVTSQITNMIIHIFPHAFGTAVTHIPMPR